MKCPRCGKENKSGATFCAGCGAKFVVMSNTRNPRQNAGTPLSGYPMAHVNPANVSPAANASTSGLLVDSDERVLATLKNGVVRNAISGDGLYKEEAFVTNKRLYYFGAHGVGSAFSMDAKVDLENISAVKVCKRAYDWLILVAVIAGLYGMVIAVGDEIENSFIAFGVAVLAVIAYFLTARKSMCVEYAGGNVTFGIKGYTMKNVRSFQNTIFKAKAAITGKK